jgi:hypothetical protein
MNATPNPRAIVRSVVVLASAVGLGLAWAPWAEAAGTVQVSVVDGDLIIQGDGADNNIILTESGVVGRAGTVVNGQALFPEGVTDDVDIRMSGGDDFVRIELPGTNLAIQDDLRISMGSGEDTMELLQTLVPGDTRIGTGAGNDIVFIDGVLGVNNYRRPDFAGAFRVGTAGGDDLLEFHHAIFRDAIDVSLGSGSDGACDTEDSEIQQPDQAVFDGGDPSGTPGDGFVAPSIELTNIVGFENFPDDCSFLGGRF